MILASGAPHGLAGSSDRNIWSDTTRIDQAHPVGVISVSWAPSTAPGAFVGSGLLDPVQNLVSGGCDNTVKVWKLYNGSWKMDCFPAFQMHTDWVRDVAWASNLGLPKSAIASASQDGTVVIWTVAKEGDQWEGRVLHDFNTPVWRVSWSLTGNILAVSDGNNNVTLWKEAVDGEWQQVTTVEPWRFFCWLDIFSVLPSALLWPLLQVICILLIVTYFSLFVSLSLSPPFRNKKNR